MTLEGTQLSQDGRTTNKVVHVLDVLMFDDNEPSPPKKKRGPQKGTKIMAQLDASFHMISHLHVLF